MKQVKGILSIMPKPAEDTSVLGKDKLAYAIRSAVSTGLGFPVMPEKWVKVIAVNENYAEGLLWEAWNDNYTATNSLLHEHDEIMGNMAHYTFSPDSEEMDRLIVQFEEAAKTMGSCFEEQKSLHKECVEKVIKNQGEKTIREIHGWHQDGFMIEGKPESMPFPEELPALLFEGKTEGEIITFTYDDIEFSFTLKEKLYGYNEAQSSTKKASLPKDFPFSDFIFADKIVAPPKPSIPLPAKIALAALGGLGVVVLLAACLSKKA